jgi:serine protease Do
MFILHFAICILQLAIPAAALAQAGAPETLATREEAALRAAVDAVAPSVVQIRTIGGLDAVEGTLLADGPTTGLIISPDGYIISSAFNFAQQPASILVTFTTGKQSPAELVATDHSRMLVLLKATAAADLPVPTFVPAGEIRPGQWAVALGRTFRADRPNISVGIVSAVNRMFGRVLQTDADVSAANYGGPLVDIRGRVFGVLVPMAPQALSPQGASELAGAEWYDSGIGFAVPLEPLATRIELMKRGEDQHSGLLGIAMATKNPHVAPADLAVVRPDGPAGQAGIKKGDRIIELDGKPIRTQTDLRFALGTKYGGDTVHVILSRGTERIGRDVKLVGELPAFRHAFLGVLPVRPAGSPGNEEVNPEEAHKGAEEKLRRQPETDDAEKAATTQASESGEDDDPTQSRGVAVRMVYPASPAEKAGVVAGDKIIQIGGTDVQAIADCLRALDNSAPGSEVTLKAIRAGEPKELTLTAARLPAMIPDDLPAAYAERPPAPVESKSGETRELKLAEFPNSCSMYVPASHDAGQAQALMIYLSGPGETKPTEVIDAWRSICDRDGMLLVVPSPSENNRWDRPDVEYLRRLSERVVAQFKIDPNRVVLFGEEAGGAMAWKLGLASRDLFRGIIPSRAALPRQLRVVPNEPSQRLAILGLVPAETETAGQIARGLQKAADAGYNVTSITTLNSAGKLSSKEREEIARWVDTLDRF